jgi:hypothetical protein
MSATEERYSRATRSSHLKMKDNAVGDVDVLTAAGMSDSLGTRLMRLRTEFDGVRRAQMVAQGNHSTASRAADAARRPVIKEKGQEDRKPTLEEMPEALQAARELSKAMHEKAKADALTAHLLILIELKSLFAAKQALGRFAWNYVESRKAEVSVGEVETIVGAVLDAWLDRLCHRCDGRGFTGGYDGPTIRCRTCRESGNRRQGVFSDRLVGQTLAERLLIAMDRKCEEADRQMRVLMRG